MRFQRRSQQNLVRNLIGGRIIQKIPFSTLYRASSFSTVPLALDYVQSPCSCFARTAHTQFFELFPTFIHRRYPERSAMQAAEQFEKFLSKNLNPKRKRWELCSATEWKVNLDLFLYTPSTRSIQLLNWGAQLRGGLLSAWVVYQQKAVLNGIRTS